MSRSDSWLNKEGLQSGFCRGVRNGTWTAPKRPNWNTNDERRPPRRRGDRDPVSRRPDTLAGVAIMNLPKEEATEVMDGDPCVLGR